LTVRGGGVIRELLELVNKSGESAARQVVDLFLEARRDPPEPGADLEHSVAEVRTTSVGNPRPIVGRVLARDIEIGVMVALLIELRDGLGVDGTGGWPGSQSAHRGQTS
jgi:hypothetical protein